MAQTYEVGRFALQANEDGSFEISGPKEYMEEQGDALLDQIVKGEDTIFSMTAHLSPNVETAILVRLQTDYAGWKGMRQALSWL